MPIWFRDFDLSALNTISQKTMAEHNGIEFTAFGDDFLGAKMPVDWRNKQPAGLLHGGASVVLAETLGSFGAHLCVDPNLYDCVGVEINANHLKSVREGFIWGTAKPLHLGQKIQVWEIRIINDKNQLTCISRLTVAVVEKRN